MGLGGNEVFQTDTGHEKEAERTLGWAPPAGPTEAGEHAVGQLETPGWELFPNGCKERSRTGSPLRVASLSFEDMLGVIPCKF